MGKRKRKMDEMTGKASQTTESLSVAKSRAPKMRWDAARKREVVLRMLRGESMDALSRELGVEIYRLEQWRDRALGSLEEALKEREAHDPMQAELDKAHKRVGELTMEVELLRMRCEKNGPFALKRSKR
jgi:transposase